MPITGAVLYAAWSTAPGSRPLRLACEGRRADPPPLDPGQCRVGAWLKAERQSARGKLPAYSGHRNTASAVSRLWQRRFTARKAEDRNGEGLARLRATSLPARKVPEKADCLRADGFLQGRKRGFRKAAPERLTARGAAAWPADSCIAGIVDTVRPPAARSNGGRRRIRRGALPAWPAVRAE